MRRKEKAINRGGRGERGGVRRELLGPNSHDSTSDQKQVTTEFTEFTEVTEVV